MRLRLRLLVFALGCVALLPAAVLLAWRMPTFGAHPLPYGDAINAAAPGERHVSNAVSAVNFDYRGLDTLGEEFMLLCAVTGVSVLLRGSRGEQRSARPGVVPGRPLLPRSSAVTLAVHGGVPVGVLFGVYVALHANTTPGGGFQGGVVVAATLPLILLGDGYRTWRKLVRFHAMDMVEGGGAALYALCGFASMTVGRPFLQNILPLGQLRDVFSGGLMLVENAGTALAVAGGFAVVFIEFLEETRAEQPAGQP